MRKKIKAQVYIPKMDIELFKKKCEIINEYLDMTSIEYDSYLADYDEKEVIVFELVTVGNTVKEVNEDYKYFKSLVKEHIGKQPKQIIKFVCDVIR